MLYDTIKKEIGKRLGDPLLDKYRALVGPVFAESVGSMILNEDYSPNDISSDETLSSPLYKIIYYEVTDSMAGVEEFSLPEDLFVRKRLQFYADVSNFGVSIPHYSPVLIEIDEDHQNRMASETALKPSAYEIYYIFGQYKVTFYLSSEWLLEEQVVLTMYYFKSPNNEIWQSLNAESVNGLNLETDVGLSSQFIQKAINVATQSLVGGEKGES